MAPTLSQAEKKRLAQRKRDAAAEARAEESRARGIAARGLDAAPRWLADCVLKLDECTLKYANGESEHADDDVREDLAEQCRVHTHKLQGLLPLLSSGALAANDLGDQRETIEYLCELLEEGNLDEAREVAPMYDEVHELAGRCASLRAASRD